MGFLGSLVSGIKKTAGTVSDVFAGKSISVFGKTIKTGLGDRKDVIAMTAPIGPSSSVGLLKTGTSTVSKIFKAITPATTKGKIIGAVTVPIAAGAVIREPTKSAKAIVKAPGELAQFGGDISSFLSDPSLTTAKNIIKESPIISAAVGVGAALAVGKVAAPLLMRPKVTVESPTTPTSQLVGVSPLGDGGTPMLPETVTVAPDKPVTPPKTNGMKQSVRINIINSPKVTGLSNKRYLKQEIYV